MVSHMGGAESDDLDQQVRDFISHECSIPLQRISVESALVDDLGIAGADGVELMLAFSRRFSVDISAMNLGLYFGDEGFSLLPWHWWRRRASITVGDLVAAARSKRWVTSAEPSNRSMEPTASRRYI